MKDLTEGVVTSVSPDILGDVLGRMVNESDGKIDLPLDEEPTLSFGDWKGAIGHAKDPQKEQDLFEEEPKSRFGRRGGKGRKAKVEKNNDSFISPDD